MQSGPGLRQSMEAHHRVNGPGTVRSSRGRWDNDKFINLSFFFGWLAAWGQSFKGRTWQIKKIKIKF